MRGLVALLLLLGACGGDAEPRAPGPPAADTAAAVVEVRDARGGGLEIRLGTRETGDIAELVRWLEKDRPAGRVELHVEHAVDDDDLKVLVDRLDEAGVACDVVGTSDPGQRLPFPERGVR